MSEETVYVGGVAMAAKDYRRMKAEIKNPDRRRRRLRAKWPIESVALAVHPDQIGEARARNKRLGINVDYKPDGKPVIPDAAAFRRLRKAERVFDRDSYN